MKRILIQEIIKNVNKKEIEAFNKKQEKEIEELSSFIIDFRKNILEKKWWDIYFFIWDNGSSNLETFLERLNENYIEEKYKLNNIYYIIYKLSNLWILKLEWKVDINKLLYWLKFAKDIKEDFFYNCSIELTKNFINNLTIKIWN